MTGTGKLNTMGEDGKLDTMRRDRACTREREQNRELEDKEKNGKDGEREIACQSAAWGFPMGGDNEGRFCATS